MTTLGSWQNKQIHLFPWDTTDTILHRISDKEKVPVSYIRVNDNLPKILQNVSWGTQDAEIPLDVANLITEDWNKPDMVSLMKTMEKEDLPLYVRYKTEKREVDEQLWDTLFRQDFQDISFAEWKEVIRQMKKEESEQKKHADLITKLYLELSTEEQQNIVGWSSEKHRVMIRVEDIRPISLLFSDLVLEEGFSLALFYEKRFEWGEKENWIVKIRRMKDPSIETVVQDLQENKMTMETGIYICHEDLETPIFIKKTDKEKNNYDIELETSNRHPDLADRILKALSIHTIKKQTDVGMVGSFVFPQLYIDISLFQDMCMNDPVVSHFLYVNELKKVNYDNQIGVCLRQDIKDTLDMETIKSHDFTLKNIHRQSGFLVSLSLQTPISEKHLPMFFLLMRQIIGRYARRRDELVKEYLTFIPDIKKLLETKQKILMKNVKTSTRPEYISKYPRMFVRNLYSVICQKNLQPVLIKEEDTYNLPKESFIRFPQEPVEEINPEYYYCPNKDYPYAGLKEMDLKGRDVFINLAPCCFNSPQDKENERKMMKLRTKDDEEETDVEKNVSKTNIISGKFLIKYPKQLGTIRPPSMKRFFMAYDPFAEYYRIGIEQSASALIGCLLMRRSMMGNVASFNPADVRVKISEDPDCVSACIQENPGLSLQQIKDDIANPNVYFDPRRFYRALELYFNVRLLVFTKEADMTEEDADLLLPFSMRTHYTNHSDLPFTIVFEHWGGKTNILSKFKHPHCELIGFKSFTEPDMRFDFNPKGIFQLLDHTLYPFDGNQHIQPFYRKECWFFRYIVGQTADPLGKIRWLHFQYNDLVFSAEVYPPIAVQDDVPLQELTPDELAVVEARNVLNFLRKFDKWEKIYVPIPDDDIVYWTVSQENVFWKNQEQHSKMTLTFVFRLDNPQPERVINRDESLQEYVLTTGPYKMIYQPDKRSSSIHHDAKIANILAQLCVSGFSYFLKENKVRRNATDMDVLIDAFAQQKIKVDPEFDYPATIHYKDDDYKDFMTSRSKKIVLPSQRFLDKIKFHIRWLLFYQPHYVFDTEKTIVNPLQEIADFSTADPKHYYCGLDEVINVLRYSVEDLYEISTTSTIGDLVDTCKKRRNMYTIWYHKDLSPYPHPSVVMLYKSIQKSREAIKIWREDKRMLPNAMVMEGDVQNKDPPSVFDFDAKENIWTKPKEQDENVANIFRAKAATANDEYLVFFPMKR